MEAYFHSLVRGERRGLIPGLLRAGCWTLSVPYGWAVRGRNWLFDHGWKKTLHAEVPVISVGNLTVGGTGKTPCVEYLARFFRRRNIRPAILSRGYKGFSHGNDEALLLHENLPDVPHLQGADRVTLARLAVEELRSDILILDDGFQHRSLHRDLNLLLIDATCPWGHGHLLPRGLLREPVSAVKRADMVLVTRCDQAGSQEIREICEHVWYHAPRTPVLETTHRPGPWINAAKKTVPLAALADRPWAAFCGIGNPDAFRRSLTQLGGQLCAWRTFPDHHNYDDGDLEDLRRWANQQPKDAVLVTTQKDLVKLRVDSMHDRELWALQVQLHLMTHPAVLEDRLLAMIEPARIRTRLGA